MLNSFKNDARGKYIAKSYSLQYINNWMVWNEISESVMSSVSFSNYKMEAMRRVLQILEGWGILFSVYLHKPGSYIGLIEGPVDPSFAKITPFDNAVAVSTVSSQVAISGLSGLTSEAMLLLPPHTLETSSCGRLAPPCSLRARLGAAQGMQSGLYDVAVVVLPGWELGDTGHVTIGLQLRPGGGRLWLCGDGRCSFSLNAVRCWKLRWA